MCFASRKDYMFFVKLKTAYEMRIRDWSSDVCSSDLALAVLTVLPPHELVRAIAAQDKASLARAQGVGPKLAGRIASELKDKAGGIALGPLAAANGAGRGVVSEDAVSALVNLGYRRAEIGRASCRERVCPYV